MEPEIPKSKSDMVELVADSLERTGISVDLLLVPSLEGGDLCFSFERKGGGQIAWGNSDANWTASIFDAEGQEVSTIETKCPSECQEVSVVVEAVLGPSRDAGAIE